MIYDNATESDLVLRSLQRDLNKDKASRRITDPDLGPLLSEVDEPDDLPTGYIYVLRSKSEHPFVAEHRSVIHKIGVTGGDVKSRIAGAKKDPTYLLSDVEIVATFKLANINRKRLEALLHKFFGGARLDLDRLSSTASLSALGRQRCASSSPFPPPMPLRGCRSAGKGCFANSCLSLRCYRRSCLSWVFFDSW